MLAASSLPLCTQPPTCSVAFRHPNFTQIYDDDNHNEISVAYVCVCVCSNVVEKCVSHSSRAERAEIIEEVCLMNDG